MPNIFKYLGDRLNEHCRDYVINDMDISPDDPEFEEIMESHKNLMEMTLYREQSEIEIAYYMEIPKKALYRFGYTNEDIKQELENVGMDPDYPY